MNLETLDELVHALVPMQYLSLPLRHLAEDLSASDLRLHISYVLDSLIPPYPTPPHNSIYSHFATLQVAHFVAFLMHFAFLSTFCLLPALLPDPNLLLSSVPV